MTIAFCKISNQWIMEHMIWGVRSAVSSTTTASPFCSSGGLWSSGDPAVTMDVRRRRLGKEHSGKYLTLSCNPCPAMLKMIGVRYRGQITSVGLMTPKHTSTFRINAFRFYWGKKQYLNIGEFKFSHLYSWTQRGSQASGRIVGGMDAGMNLVGNSMCD